MAYSETFKQEIVRLRVEDQLSLKAISERMGVSKGTVSLWLRKHPLPKDLVRERKQEGGRVANLGNTKPRGVPSARLAPFIGKRTYTRQEKGNIAEAAVAYRLLLHQFHIFGSPFDGEKEDWIARSPTGDLFKIQVKCVKVQAKNKGLPLVPLRCRDYSDGGNHGRRNYREGELDILVGYDLLTDTCYVWTWDEIKHLKSTVSVCPEAAERWDKVT